ncbi:hypothetical protein J3P71_06430 [Rhizobium leguminosarum]|uniref:hypothetical protein n=1 Tax=Rhizobium leguminosarum TaxID=384 RepID=UPI001441A28E|nr:hypothetical protein [Rhizobium leguminosarum]MBY5839828.1 hypothetical protein [Rhizobium leguminosarum]NKM82511.1 hypothetical protein [Rhizobium leguminosarum bv. viciae]QSZ09403.1 hypothetical protein J3P71_06430 [Rhizobium leguminosarum]
MKINLQNYRQEFDHWIKAFDPFVDHASKSALPQLHSRLEDGIDNKRESFTWELKKPVTTIVAESYDKKEESGSHPIRIDWQFKSVFERCEDTKKKKIWSVKEMCTHFSINDASGGDEIMHFHVDLKNDKQLGPHVHFQFSEEYMEKNVGVRLAVPRFPLATVLPTDCMDFVLSEFFPHRWPQSQSGAHGLKNLREAQRKRLENMAMAVATLWVKNPNRTPVSITQDYHIPDFVVA